MRRFLGRLGSSGGGDVPGGYVAASARTVGQHLAMSLLVAGSYLW